MPNDKEIKIGLGLNTEKLDRQLSDVVRRMERTTKALSQSSTTQGFNPDTPQGRTFQRIFQREREIELKQLTKLQMDYTGQVNKAEDKIRRITNLIKEQRGDQEKLTRELEKQHRISSQAATGAIGAQYQASQLGGGGAGGGNVATVGGIARFMGSAAPAMFGPAGIGHIAAGLGLYGQFLGHTGTREREVMGFLGRGTQAANISFQHMMQSRGFMNQYESGERMEALKTAMQERDIRLQRDPIQSIAAALGKGAMGAAGLGFLGGPLGAIVGGIGGAGLELFGNKGTFRQVFDRDAYMAEVNADTLKNFRANLIAKRLQDPSKYAASDFLGRKSEQYQNLQRAMGFSDEDILSGAVFNEAAPKAPVLEDITDITSKSSPAEIAARNASKTAEYNKQMQEYNKRRDDFNAYERRKSVLERSQLDPETGLPAFSEQRIINNMQQILAAGGNAGFAGRGMGARNAAVFQRMGMTGAAGELGALSALGVNSVDEYKKILAEAHKAGIDGSTMINEQRRFVSAAVNIMTRTEGATGARKLFGQMVGDEPTSAGIAAAQNALGMAQSLTAQGSGYQGALKWAFMGSAQGQKLFSNIEDSGTVMDIKSALTNIGVEQLSEDHPVIRQYAKLQFGGDTKKAMASALKISRSGIAYSERTQGLINKARETGYQGDIDAAYLALGRERPSLLKTGALTAQSFGRFLTSGEDFLKQETTAFDIPKFLNRDFFDKAEASKARDEIAQRLNLSGKQGDLSDALERNITSTDEQAAKILKNTSALEDLTKALVQNLNNAQLGIIGNALGPVLYKNQAQGKAKTKTKE